MKTQFRGIFLTSDNLTGTARFYEQVAGLALAKVGDESSYVYWRIDDGQMQIALHDARRFADYTHPLNAGSNATHLYFKIDDQTAFLRHLSLLKVKPYAMDDVVVTVEDPDGRKVMFGTA